MQDSTHTRILRALLIALRPLARTLLRAGIGYREFSEISKTAFVDVSTSDYGLRGRPTNISRVAVMTGLTRKEVRRIRDKSTSRDQFDVPKPTPMGTILHRWYTEPDYLNPNGTPKVLPFDGDGKTFSDLVRRFGGDIPPGAMRTELKRIKAVEEVESGSLRVLKRNISGLEIDEKIVTGLERIMYPAAITFAHNTDIESQDDLWVMRVAVTKNVRNSDIARVRRITSDRLAEFVDSVDDLFAAYETLYDDGADGDGDGDSAIGIGVFYFEDDEFEMF